MNNQLSILETEKRELRAKVGYLVELKNKLYSNVDIETAMSVEEKELTNEIADIFSRLNQIVKEKRTILKNS